MTQPRKPRPYDPLERRIHDLEATKVLHGQLTRIARLEREVAALPDPDQPTNNEIALHASRLRVQMILADMAKMQEACEEPSAGL